MIEVVMDKGCEAALSLMPTSHDELARGSGTTSPHGNDTADPDAENSSRSSDNEQGSSDRSDEAARLSTPSGTSGIGRRTDTADASHPDLSGLSDSERQSIEAACSNAKYLEGPAAYNICLQDHLASVARSPNHPDLSRLSESERQSIEAACSNAKYVEGPAAYNECLVHQMRLLTSNRQ